MYWMEDWHVWVGATTALFIVGVIALVNFRRMRRESEAARHETTRLWQEWSQRSRLHG